MKTTGFPVHISIKIFTIAINLLALLGIIAYLTHQKIDLVNQHIHDLADYIIPITNVVTAVEIKTLQQEADFERVVKLFLTTSDDNTLTDQRQQFRAHGIEVQQQLTQAIALAVKLSNSTAIAQTHLALQQIILQLQQIRVAFQAWHAHNKTILQQLAKAGGADIPTALEEPLRRAQQQLNEKFEILFSKLSEHTMAVARASQQQQQQVMYHTLIITGVAILFGLIYALILTASIVRPLRYLTKRIQTHHANGNKASITVKSRDEIGFLTMTFNQILAALAEKRRLKETFGQYIDPRLVENLEQEKTFSTTGERQIVTVLFSQTDGFTAHINHLPPEQMIAITNQYLDLFSTIITAHKGIVEFVETTIKGFWAKPFVSETEHALYACQAALEQRGQLTAVRKMLKNSCHVHVPHNSIDLHIGIATGPLILGNIGPNWSMMYTVLGDTVNTAARLKGAAKQFGVQILLMQDTWRRVNDVMATRELGLIQTVGKEEKLNVYELLGRKNALDPTLAALEACFAQALTCYRQKQWSDAERYFQHCLTIKANDRPSQRYLEWIQDVRDTALSPDWDGVWKLTKK